MTSGESVSQRETAPNSEVEAYLRTSKEFVLSYLQNRVIVGVGGVQRTVEEDDISFPEQELFTHLWDNEWFGESGIYSQSQDKERYKQVLALGYTIASYAHGPQKRDRGGHYMEHILCVASYVNMLDGKYAQDIYTVTAALLHDTIEDSKSNEREVTDSDVSILFTDVLSDSEIKLLISIIDGCTKVREAPSKDVEAAQTMEKIIEHIVFEPRVAVIKFADRLHNTEDLAEMYFSGEKGEKRARRKAKETYEIYGPLAKMLGMHELSHVFMDRSAFVLWGRDLYDYVESQIRDTEYINFAERMDIHNFGYIQQRKPYVYEVLQRARKRTRTHALKQEMLSLEDMSPVVDIVLDNPHIESIYHAYTHIIGQVLRNGMVDTGKFSLFEKMQRNIHTGNLFFPIQTTLRDQTGTYDVMVFLRQEHETEHAPFTSYTGYKVPTIDNQRRVEEQLRRIKEMYDQYKSTGDAKDFLDHFTGRLSADDTILFSRIVGEKATTEHIFIEQEKSVIANLLLQLTPEEFSRIQSITIDNETFLSSDPKFISQLRKYTQGITRFSIELGDVYTVDPSWLVPEMESFETSIHFGRVLEFKYNQILAFEERKVYQMSLETYAKQWLNSMVQADIQEFAYQRIELMLPDDLRDPDLYQNVALGLYTETELFEIADVRKKYWERLTVIQVESADKSGLLQSILNAVDITNSDAFVYQSIRFLRGNAVLFFWLDLSEEKKSALLSAKNSLSRVLDIDPNNISIT